MTDTPRIARSDWSITGPPTEAGGRLLVEVVGLTEVEGQKLELSIEYAVLQLRIRRDTPPESAPAPVPPPPGKIPPAEEQQP